VPFALSVVVEVQLEAENSSRNPGAVIGLEEDAEKKGKERGMPAEQMIHLCCAPAG